VFIRVLSSRRSRADISIEQGGMGMNTLPDWQQTRRRIGENIRYWRKKQGLELEVLAGRLGLKEKTLLQYEMGKREIPLHTLYRIASGLEMSLPVLLIPVRT